jgi:hypothetical protein
MMEDLGLQYDFVGRGQIEEGKLASGEYKVVILPQSLAMSPLEVDQVRDFVNAGGLLVADYRVATMNEHGRDLGHGQLDDVFGITHVKGAAKGASVEGVADLGNLHLKGEKLSLEVGDEALRVTSGKALAQSGAVPLVVVNEYGKGKAIYMNVETGRYPYERLQTTLTTSLPDVMEQVFGLAGVEPQVRVLDAAGKRVPGTEVVRFTNGDFEHVAVFRNPQFDDGGWGDLPTKTEREWAGSIDNSNLEKDAQATLTWSSVLPTYDLRGKKALGETAKVQLLLDAFSPLVVTRAAKAVPSLRVEVPEELQAGAPLMVTLRSDVSLAPGTFRVVRLEFTTPAGEVCDLYSRNVRVDSASHTERFDFALNDPKGQWQLTAHDVVTGQAVPTGFRFRG